VIPLLFEVDLAREFDVTVCVACSAASQRARLVDRGWTQQQIDQRLGAQWPLDRKLALADRVIWNDGSREVLAEQARRVFLVDQAHQRS
jgi:dephospho-CoA kinase